MELVMSITQERLMRIIDAAEHIAEKHEELYKAMCVIGDINTASVFFEYQKRMPGLLRSAAIDRDKLSLVLREVAHFRVHFKRNARRAALLRLHRANPKVNGEDQLVDDYFEGASSSSEEILEEDGRTICPLCGERALSNENWRHKEDCEYWDSKEAGDAEVARRGAAGTL